MLWQKFNNNRLFHTDKSARVLYLERFYNAFISWLCQEKCVSFFKNHKNFTNNPMRTTMYLKNNYNHPISLPYILLLVYI